MKSFGHARDDQRGFTLTELLVAMAIVSLVMTGLLTLLKKGNETYLAGANQVEAQATVRAALERMTQEIREAGYNPLGLPPCVAPLVPPNCLDGIINQTATSFIIQNDWNGNGTIEPAISVTMAYSWGNVQRGEQITYTIAGGNLNRTESGPAGGGLQTVMASAVQPLDPVNVGQLLPFFQYLDSSGCVIGACNNPTTLAPTTQADIRTVVVNFRVGVQNTAPQVWQTGAVQVTMSDRIRLRNRIP